MFDYNTYNWKDKFPYPFYFKVGATQYSCESTGDIFFKNINPSYGTTNFDICKVTISDLRRNVSVANDVKIISFWHEYVHTLFYTANEFSLNDEEFIVDNLAVQFRLFFDNFKTISKDLKI